MTIVSWAKRPPLRYHTDMIAYHFDRKITVKQLRSLIEDSQLQRPTTDEARLQRMLEHANLLLTAWDGEKLVGFARGLTDRAYCCYLSDLAVAKDYQRRGIGRKLM